MASPENRSEGHAKTERLNATCCGFERRAAADETFQLSRTVFLADAETREARAWRAVWPKKFWCEPDAAFPRRRPRPPTPAQQAGRVHLHPARRADPGHRCRRNLFAAGH